MKVEPIIKRQIAMACCTYSRTEWSRYLERWDEGKVIRRNRSIDFEGTEKEFDDLIDLLHKDESNSKVIGIFYEGGTLIDPNAT